ncbi:hypothetical protein H6F89_28905 [Cyanobacteria bacterium FACHB-63]|nr:hypothetical protein [Cyanobacteria bacterium FACHB-63]
MTNDLSDQLQERIKRSLKEGLVEVHQKERSQAAKKRREDAAIVRALIR